MLQGLNAKLKSYKLRDDVTVVEPENCTKWIIYPGKPNTRDENLYPDKLLFLPEHNFLCADILGASFLYDATTEEMYTMPTSGSVLYDATTEEMYTIPTSGSVVDVVHLSDGYILTLEDFCGSKKFYAYQLERNSNTKQRKYKISKQPNVFSYLNFL